MNSIMRRHLFVGLLISFILIPTSLLRAMSVKDAHVEAELVSEGQWIQPGHEFWVALRLNMDEGWHTYWKNPGDSGLATRIKWELPEGMEAGEIEWPYPEQINPGTIGPLTGYGYHNKVLLLIPIKVDESFSSDSPVTLKASVRWLTCEKICIPGKGELLLDLPIKNEVPKVNSKWFEAFARARSNLPIEESVWRLRAFYTDKEIIIKINEIENKPYRLKNLSFFPDSGEVIQHAEPQILSVIKGGYQLRIQRSDGFPEIPKILEGVLVGEAGWRGMDSEKALHLNLMLEPLPKASSIPFSLALLFAFIGGMILNLMPCVLPVLSLKILNFMNHAGQSKWKGFGHGLIYTGGVLTSFWVLAGLLIALRKGGLEIGWGFQLQSPVFLICLLGFFFLFALNLFGIFEVGNSLMGIGLRKENSSEYMGSFMSGVLATIVATPCTAPFMGAALGLALTLSSIEAFGIFTLLGLGMAFPYLLLSLFPALRRYLPAPGEWMNTLKQIMGFLLLATVLWLHWLLGRVQGDGISSLVLWGLLLMGAGAWILGKWAIQTRVRRSRMIARLFALILIGMGFYMPIREVLSVVSSDIESTQRIQWEDFSEERLASLLKDQIPVFVDFTASWCLTCQVNERVVLNSQKVVNHFKEKGIVALKADWTHSDEKITLALAKYERSSIPLYVYYPKGQEQPVLLPEILTTRIVIETLE